MIPQISIPGGRAPLRRLRGALMMGLLGAACASNQLAVTRYSWLPTPDLRTTADGVIRSDAALSGVVGADWLRGPARILASKQERERFAKLETEPARRQFVEKFWRDRDPEPGSGRNEFRQEFDRRVLAANAAFGHDDEPGWSTLFGVTLLVFGFPYDVTVNRQERDGGIVEVGALAVPSKARGGDEVVWHYVPGALSGASLQLANGNPLYVQFGYARGGWRMTCGTAVRSYGWVGSDYVAGSGGYVGGGPSGGTVPEDAYGMVGSYRGPLLTGGGVYDTGSSPATISSDCQGLLSAYGGLLFQ